MKRKYKIDKVFEVNENDSVRDANDKVDPYFVWKDIVRFINYYGTEIEEPKKPVTYCVGDKFRDSDGDTCMIVSVGNKKCTVVVVDAKSLGDIGFEYMDVVSVSDQRHITQEELDTMAGPAYAPLTKIEEE